GEAASLSRKEMQKPKDYRCTTVRGARWGRQVRGENRASMGNSSRRPASMSKLSSHLHQGEKSAKEPMGPTISRPGPTLLKQVATAVKVVMRSKPSNESATTDPAKIRM